VLGESSLLSADCTGKVAPVSRLRKKTSQEREKFAAVSRLAEVFPLASVKHRKAKRVSADSSNKGNDHAVATGLLRHCHSTEALAMYETLDILVIYSDC